MNTNGKIILGFMLGTAIGTMTALLLAPSTGLQARKKLNRKAKKMVKQIEAFVGKGKVKKVTSPVHRKNGKAAIASH